MLRSVDPGLGTQRARAHGQRPARLVPVLRHRQQLHRARCAVGKPIRRVVQRPVARRVPGRRAVRQPARGAGADRGLADRVQHEAPAQQPGLARPGCLRRALGSSATRWTLISGGLAKGVRSHPSRTVSMSAGRNCTPLSVATVSALAISASVKLSNSKSRSHTWMWLGGIARLRASNRAGLSTYEA